MFASLRHASLPLLALCGALQSGGCAHPITRTGPAANFPLAAPGTLAPRAATQVIHAVYGARATTLRTAIELDANRLKVVGVSAMGQRLFTVSWDGTKVAADKSPYVPDHVEPERVLADMQLALWPLAAIQPALRAAGLEVSEPFAGVRRLRRGTALIAEVHYASADPWNGRLWFVSFEFDYSLTIDTSGAP